MIENYWYSVIWFNDDDILNFANLPYKKHEYLQTIHAPKLFVENYTWNKNKCIILIF